LRRRQAAETERLHTEIRLLEEELAIKDARWSRLPARRRPHYGPVQRMRILELRAVRGWSVEQAASRFLATEETIASWIRRLDEEGEHALVQIKEPVNKFPAYVAYLVRSLKLLCPTLGKAKIAQVLARAGLHLGATTVGRMLKARPPRGEAAAAAAVTKKRRVTAQYPNHVWHVDLTVVPTLAGFWIPWLPHARPQGWPFCWWLAVAVDHASRLCVGFAVFAQRPTSPEVCAFLNRAIKNAGSRPRHIISDRGSQFDCLNYKGWCRWRHIRYRFGAVGQHGSIAIVERFIRSMKAECARRILVPFGLAAMRTEVSFYIDWYNEHRPHSALGGRTPQELYRALPPANQAARFEPRPRWPRKSRCASPAAPIKGRRGSRLKLVVDHIDGRAHLPVVELKRAA
jgi:putative transposase